MPDAPEAIRSNPRHRSRRFEVVRVHASTWNHDEEIRILKRLWDRQAAEIVEGFDANRAYVADHFGMDMTLRRRLRVLDQITPLLHGRVLEWGCQHAIDSCVYRLRLGDAIELHGCDVLDPSVFAVFHGFSGLCYRRIWTDPVALDYPDHFFDVVTSNGVLEHVHDDAASLGELFRILKPGGTLVITCLPNRWSYTEALQRLLKHNAHDRLYTIRSTRAMLSAAGFEVLDSGYAFLLPTMLYGFPRWAKAAFNRLDRPLRPLNAALERVWPLNRLASNLWLIARKPAERSELEPEPEPEPGG